MNPEKITVAPFLPWMNKFAARNPLQGLTPDQAAKARTSYAAREAAKLSTGPRTDQGKAISSKNARKHGFSGAQIVIDDEDQAAYDAHLDAYHQTLEPTNQVEADTVRLAANAMWRIDRLTSIETGILELEMGLHAPHIDAKLQNMTTYHYMAISFMEHTNDTNAADLCRRYLSSAQRDYQRALDLLFKLKEHRLPIAQIAQPEDLPTPAVIHIVTPRPPNEPATPTQKTTQTAVKPTQVSKNEVTRSAKRRKSRR